jgi:hypothetical protein
MVRNIEEKIVFGFAPPADPTKAATLIIGVPQAAWEYMKDGKTHTLDLTRIGIPIQLLLYGADSHDTAMRYIQEHNSKQGIPYLDERQKDFGITEAEPPESEDR